MQEEADRQQFKACVMQVIALIAYLVEERQSSEPFMIVVPSSLITNWEQEFQQWAPSLNLIAYKGTADARAALFANKVGNSSKPRGSCKQGH